MNKMEKLQRRVEEAKERFAKEGDFDLVGHVTGIVIPQLKDLLKDRCHKIEERHKLDEPKDREENFVIHYTSLNTLVSMLQQAAKNRQDEAKKGQNEAEDKQNAADEQDKAKKGQNKVQDKQDEAKDEQESSKDDSKDEQNASLRLYDYVHFNDPDEGNYFYRNLNLPKKHGWLDEKKESHAYIASFICPNKNKDMGDNLVFWRTYGKEGEGCSLKLRIPRDRLRKVLYGPSKVKLTNQTLQLQPVLNALYPLVSIRNRLMKQKIQEELAEAIWKSLARLRYLYKSEAYEYERECRFITPEFSDKDKICFESKEQNNYPPRIRHYCEEDILKVENILRTGSLITIGPCLSDPDFYNMSYYIKSLLNKAGLAGPKIKRSEISYRKS